MFWTNKHYTGVKQVLCTDNKHYTLVKICGLNGQQSLNISQNMWSERTTITKQESKMWSDWTILSKQESKQVLWTKTTQESKQVILTDNNHNPWVKSHWTDNKYYTRVKTGALSKNCTGLKTGDHNRQQSLTTSQNTLNRQWILHSSQNRCSEQKLHRSQNRWS